MLKNITLGQYFPGDTPIHRLDPRIKLIISLLLLVTIFVVNSFVAFAVMFVFVAVVASIAHIGAKTMINGVRPLLFIIIFAFALNILFYDGEQVLWSYGILKISVEGIIKAFFLAIRLVLLIMTTSLLTLTTSPMQLTDGLESLLGPLKKVKVPVHEMAMMMSIAMRFIPTLIDETDRIMKAQTARGAEFDSGNLLKKAKNMIPLLVPLFVGAFKRADELALAMESRCYRGGQGRTKLKVLKLRTSDVASIILCAAFAVLLMILLRQEVVPALRF
ncbi:MAG: energy-coupling factor transporter transmembrane component T family protein [Christensenellaceae bacterium]|jgi:energy-coupling factor transport system permease protein